MTEDRKVIGKMTWGGRLVPIYEAQSVPCGNHEPSIVELLTEAKEKIQKAIDKAKSAEESYLDMLGDQ